MDRQCIDYWSFDVHSRSSWTTLLCQWNRPDDRVDAAFGHECPIWRNWNRHRTIRENWSACDRDWHVLQHWCCYWSCNCCCYRWCHCWNDHRRDHCYCCCNCCYRRMKCTKPPMKTDRRWTMSNHRSYPWYFPFWLKRKRSFWLLLSMTSISLREMTTTRTKTKMNVDLSCNKSREMREKQDWRLGTRASSLPLTWKKQTNIRINE